MERKKYVIGIGVIVGAVVGFSVTRGNLVTPLIAVLGGILLLYLCKMRVNEVVEDERNYKISEQASQRTVQLVGIFTAALGLLIIGLSRSGYIEREQIGFMLAYFATALFVVYMIFYWYYSRQYGA